MTPSPVTPAERIENLVRTGSIAPSEGQRLLTALGGEGAPRRSFARLLTNPFERLGGELTAGIGLVVAALSVGVAHLGVRFDGALDLHVVRHAVSVRVALLDQVVAWLVPALLFWLYARALSPGRRLRDFVGVVGVARLPLLLFAGPALALTPELPFDPAHPPARLLAVALLALAFIAPFLTLLYRGFANASGLRGAGRLIGGFVAVLLASELLSKLLLAVLT
ncbi:MAG: hypothetical protein JWP97_305 [Labilithrix sp.]|nr:hypothetical protein [Labilithrix sp.]